MSHSIHKPLTSRMFASGRVISVNLVILVTLAISVILGPVWSLAMPGMQGVPRVTGMPDAIGAAKIKSHPSVFSPWAFLGLGERGATFGKMFDAATITIVDEDLHPVPNAQVLIGQSLDQPFANNFLTAGADGTLIAPAGWTTPLPVTIQAQGFVRMTYDQILPIGGTLILRRASTRSHITVQGTAAGFGEIPSSDDAYVAMVVPSFTWSSITSFDLGSMLSPEVDTVSTPVMDLKIPSNLAIPAQDLKYGFFAIHVDKPDFRLIFQDPARVQVAAIRVHFPFQTVADMLRNKEPFTEVLKQFSFDSAGLRNFDVHGDMNQPVPVNELTMQPIATYQAGQIPDDQIVLAAYLARAEENKIFPTDVKAVKTNEKVTLGGLIGAAGYVGIVRMQKKKSVALNDVTSSANAFSLYEVPTAPRSNPALDLIKTPLITGRTIKAIPPAGDVVKDLILRTQITFQDVDVSTSSMGRLERTYPKWIVIHQGWANSFTVPDWPQDNLQGARWEVSFSAGGDREQHVTRNHTL